MGAKASRVRMTGPLMAHAPGFASALTRAGYTENGTADQVRLLAHLSRWLAAQGPWRGRPDPRGGRRVSRRTADRVEYRSCLCDDSAQIA